MAVVTITTTIIGAALANKFKDDIVIISTALIGSYAFVRGLSLLIGGFPNEFTLYQEIQDGTATYSYGFIGYLVGIAALFVAGFWY